MTIFENKHADYQHTLSLKPGVKQLMASDLNLVSSILLFQNTTWFIPCWKEVMSYVAPLVRLRLGDAGRKETPKRY